MNLGNTRMDSGNMQKDSGNTEKGHSHAEHTSGTCERRSATCRRGPGTRERTSETRGRGSGTCGRASVRAEEVLPHVEGLREHADEVREHVPEGHSDASGGHENLADLTLFVPRGHPIATKVLAGVPATDSSAARSDGHGTPSPQRSAMRPASAAHKRRSRPSRRPRRVSEGRVKYGRIHMYWPCRSRSSSVMMRMRPLPP